MISIPKVQDRAMEHASLHISNMSCGHCVSRVHKALAALTGVKVKTVTVGEAEVEFDPTLQSLAAVTAALGAAGYPAQVQT
jgi:copper chaperone